MNREGKLILRAAVGGYLVYLAYKLITAQQTGDTEMSGAVAYGAAALLSICGAVFCCYALAQYLKDKKNVGSTDGSVNENEEAFGNGGEEDS